MVLRDLGAEVYPFLCVTWTCPLRQELGSHLAQSRACGGHDLLVIVGPQHAPAVFWRLQAT